MVEQALEQLARRVASRFRRRADIHAGKETMAIAGLMRAPGLKTASQ